jgi:hypothetical protein
MGLFKQTNDPKTWQKRVPHEPYVDADGMPELRLAKHGATAVTAQVHQMIEANSRLARIEVLLARLVEQGERS